MRYPCSRKCCRFDMSLPLSETVVGCLTIAAVSPAHVKKSCGTVASVKCSRTMSRGKSSLSLPYAIQQELSLEFENARRRRTGPHGGRKEQRRDDRVEKRHPAKRPANRVRKHSNDDNEAIPDFRASVAKVIVQAKKSSKVQAHTYTSATASKPPKSILKKPPPPRSFTSSDDDNHDDDVYEDSDDDSLQRPRSLSPEIVLDASSRNYKDRLAQDESEISALEKRLGLKNKKRSSAFDGDGIGDLLEGLDSEDESKKRRRDGRKWLERKRRKVQDSADENADVSSGDEFGESDTVEDTRSLGQAGSEEDMKDMLVSVEDSEGESLDSAEAESEYAVSDERNDAAKPMRPSKVRENPYLPPVSPGASSVKYVPPSLRRAQNGNGQSTEKLKRQLQGHLNKLSEANLVSILTEIEKTYQTNPRQEVTTILIELLLGLFCNPASQPNTFVILHAGFAAAVYKIVGTDFGAELLTQLVERFEQYYKAGGNSKEALNLLSLLSNLFTFGVVSSAIVFDHIRLLLDSFTEGNTELLLRVIRDCGPQLRSEDSNSLKQIVQLTQQAASTHSTSSSVRTKFMIETIVDLRNNRMRDSTSNSSLTKEHITRMRKTLGSLNSRSLRATEPLRISLSDLKSSERKGKWWLVGASWKGGEPSPDPSAFATAPEPSREDIPDLSMLARQYALHTPVQRSIFTALMTASHYEDAFIRITKLRLKRSQEPEIAKVLVRCASAEQSYNPYYALTAKRLCMLDGSKRLKKSFDFALWGFLRRLGEHGDGGEDDEDDVAGEVDINEVANVANLYASLLKEGVVSIAALRVLDLAYLKEKAQLLVEMMLIQILVSCQGKEVEVHRVFARANEAPQVVSRLQLFVKRYVRKSDLVRSHERDMVKTGCKVALKTLEGSKVESRA